MPQYVIIAWDGIDEEAAARRQAARPRHLATVAEMFADGRMKEGGAILDSTGKIIGSVCIVEFPDRAGLDEWLLNDPYITDKVWESVELFDFRCAPREKMNG